TTRTERGHFDQSHACSGPEGGHKLLTSLLRRGGGTGRRRRLKIARAHALRGSIPLLGIIVKRHVYQGFPRRSRSSWHHTDRTPCPPFVRVLSVNVFSCPPRRGS